MTAAAAALNDYEEKPEKPPSCLVFSLTPHVFFLSRDWKWTSMHAFVRVFAYLNIAIALLSAAGPLLRLRMCSFFYEMGNECACVNARVQHVYISIHSCTLMNKRTRHSSLGDAGKRRCALSVSLCGVLNSRGCPAYVFT